MDIRKLQRAIVDGLEDVKAQDIVVLNTEHLSPLFERVIIASGTSNRQTKALASSVRETVKDRGLPVLRTEGEDNGEWIIVDCGAAVVHIMQPAIREYYHLEEIWGGKPVRMKLGEAKTGLVKASEPMAAPAVPAKKVAVAKTARTPATKSVAPKAGTKPAGSAKTAAKKAAAGKAASTRTAARKTAASAPSAKPPRAVTGKAPARPAAAKRPAARKTPAAKKSVRPARARG